MRPLMPVTFAVVAALALAGCGAPSAAGPTWSVNAWTWPRARFRTPDMTPREIGGGTFGIVAESNWTVCETDPPPGRPTPERSS